MAGPLDPDKLREVQARMQEIAEWQLKIREDASKYWELVDKVRQLNETLVNTQEIISTKIQRINDLRAEGTAEAAAQADIEEARVDILQQANDELREQADQYRDILDRTNKLAVNTKTTASALGALGKALPGIGRGIAGAFRSLDATGIFEMDKEIRNAARSMSIGERGFQKLADHLNKAAATTVQWGVDVKKLAVLQKEYSEEIGRSVQFSEAGAEAMSLLAQGTGLGEDFAVGLTSEMDKFGMSIENTAKVVQETVDLAAAMGVNSAAATKTLMDSLKTAQRFNFKGGVKGVSTMAVKAERLRLDIEGIAAVADKVFRPEAAIEMAAQLATMGGQFAALGDPMQLMFKARNDMEGFALDIAKATSEFVEFNKETGEFELKGGLAADRMREIANITGLGVNELREMATQQKKIQTFGTLVPSVFSKDDTEMLASLARFNTDSQSFEITVGGDVKRLERLTQADVDRVRGEQQTLKERARQAQTAKEDWQNFVRSIQQTVLEVAQMLKDDFSDPLMNLVAEWEKKGVYDAIKNLVKSAGKFSEKVGGFVIGVTKLLGLKGILMGWGALKAATWIANGVALGQGFLMRTRGLRGMVGGQMTRTTAATQAGRGLSGNMGRVGRAAAGRGLGIGAVTGLGSLGLDFARSRRQDPNDRGGKAMGVGSSALRGAGIGATIGSFIPVVGTAAGGLIGAGIGGIVGAHREYMMNDGIIKFDKEDLKKLAFDPKKNTLQFDDTLLANVAKSVGQQRGINEIGDEQMSQIQFNPRDKFIQLDDALIAGTHEAGNKQLAKTIQESTSGGGKGVMNHKFEDINININVSFPGNENMGVELAKDQTFIRRITEAIKENITTTMKGGKLSPNPIAVS